MTLIEAGTSSRRAEEPSRRNSGPARTTVSTILAEDTVFTHGTISVHADSPVAMFANPFREGAEEFFVLDADSHLTYVHRSPTGDGWVQEEFNLETPQLVSDVVTAVHLDGSVWVFVSYGSTEGGLSTYRLEKDGWHGYPYEGLHYDWRYLSVHYLPDRPATPCVFGVDTSRSRLQVLMPSFPDGDETFWENTTALTLPTPLPMIFRAGMQLDGTLRIFADDGQYITMRTYSGSWEREILVAGAPGVPHLAGLWNAPEGLGCVYVSGNGRPCAFTPGDGAPAAWELSADVLTQAVTWQDDQGLLHIFGTSAARPGVCEVIHQRGWVTRPNVSNTLVEPLFVTAPLGGLEEVVAFPLAGGVAAFHLDPAPDAYPSQLLVPAQAGAPYRVASQDVTTSWWSEEAVTMTGPGGVAVLQRRYICDVTLRDGFGVPMPNWPVQVSAQSAVEVDVAGRMLRLGPAHTAHAVTDAVGKLTLRIAAPGLTVPTIQVAAKGMAEGASVDVASGVQGFLAGTSVLAAHPSALSAKELLAAKVGDDWLVPGWHDQAATGIALPTAQEVVDACAQLFALTHGSAPVDGAGPVAGFVIQTNDAGQAAYRELQRGEATRDAPAATPGLAPYVHDLWRGIRDGVLEVVECTVKGSGHAVVACQAPNGVRLDFEYDLVSDVDASLAVEAIFQMLGAGVDGLVAWLTWPFPFKAVWQTAEAMSAAMKDLPQLLTATAKHYQELLKGGWFVAHADQIASALATGHVQVNGLRVDSFPGVLAVDGSLPAPIYQPDALVTPQSMWLHDLLLSRGGVSPAVAPALTPHTADPLWDPVWRLFVDSGPGKDFQTRVETARAALLGLWDPDDARAVEGTTLDAMFGIVESLVVPRLLPLADVMIESLGTLMAGIATDMDDTLARPVTSADLQAMYQWFQRQAGVPDGTEKQLTIGGLGALYAAFPLTGAYTALLGTAPFPSGTFPSLVPPWGPTSSGTSASREVSLAMQVLAGLAQSIYTGIDIYVDMNEVSQDLNRAIGLFELLGFSACGYPEFYDTPADSDVGDQIAWAQWALWTFLYAADFYLGTKPAEHWLVTEYNGNKGSALLMAIGVAQVALAGAAYGVSEKTDLDKKWLLAGVMGSLSTVTAPLRLLQNLPVTDPSRRQGLAFKVMLDGIADGVSGLAYTTLAVNELVNPVRITTTSIPQARIGQPYEASIEAAGGCPPYTWVLESFVPSPGLHFDPDTGVISGTPEIGSKGNYDLVLSVVDYYPPPSTSPKVTLVLSVVA